MAILIDVALLFVVLLLSFPKPLWVTVKNVTPVLLVLGAALCVIFILQAKEEKAITITALDQQNEAADGSEIIITGVTVNGTEYRADTIFSGRWINENGNLRWRNYDRPTDMTNAVSAKIPAGATLDIQFETNKWRGCVQIQEGNFFSIVYRVDCYSNSSDKGNTIAYLSARSLSGVRMSGKVLLLCLFGLLAILALGFSAFSKSRKAKMPQRTENNREAWLDMLKACSAPLIVLIHTVGGPYSSIPLDSTRWIGYLILNTVPRCAVPVFLMVSGILLIGRKHSAAKVWLNAKKALILLVIWNLVYIFIQALLWGPSESLLSQILSLPVKRGPSGHLWYAYLLVWIYLFAPIVNSLYRALTNRLRIYFVLLTVIIPGILDLYTTIFDSSTSSILYAFQLYMTLTYIGIMFVGRLIYDNAEQIKRLGRLSLLAILIGLGGMLAVTYYYSAARHTATDKFITETQLLAVCYAGGVIGVGAKYREAFEHLPATIKRALEWLSRHSLGTYFFHVLPVWTIGSIKLLGFSLSVYDGVGAALVFCIIYYILTVIGVGLMARIPFLKKVVT